MFVVTAVGLLSCEDFVDPTPYGIAENTTFFTTEDHADLAINAAYRNLRFWHDGFNGDYGWGNVGTDDAHKGGASPADMEALRQRETWEILPTVGSVTGKWAQDFQGIRAANEVLANVPGIDMDEAKKNRIIGEAYFLRGAYYFDLAKTFGGVPIFRENVDINDYLNVGRNTMEETYAFVEENLLEALNRLPKKSEYVSTDGGANLGRATQGAALGFLIRANAYQGNMSMVKQYAEDLFALNEYTIEGVDYAEIFTPAGETGPGSIFEVQYKENGQGWGPVLGNTSGHAYSARSGGYGGWGFVMATQSLLDEYETDDPRLDATLYNVPDQPYAPLDGVNSYFGRKVAYEPFSAYPRPAAANDGGVNWRVLRLADIYLLYAEALFAEGNEAGAREYVNRVRARARGDNAGILPDVPATVTGSDLLDAIYHERRVELALEGERFHDLIRTGRTNLLNTGFQTGKHEFMPIPQNEIDNFGDGNVLQQNPGY